MKKRCYESDEGYKARKAAWPEYEKIRKKFRKQLIKAAKDFRDFDFGWMIDVIDPMIRSFYNLHSRKEVISYSTKNEETNGMYWDGEDQWNKINADLKRCIELLDEYRDHSPSFTDKRTEDSVLKELFQIIGENICMWWD